MATNFYPCTSITGTNDGALKHLHGADLSNGAIALVVMSGLASYYILDADSALTENIPVVVSPTTAAGDKRWLFIASTAATITIGTVATGAPGSSVTVENSGTINNAIFDFSIPEGDKGDTGASITSAAFVSNDIVFTKDDSTTVTLVNAKVTLKGEKGDTGDITAELEQLLEDAEQAVTDAQLAETNAGLDAIATAADRVQTGLDVIATAADRIQVNADHDQTALDVIATAADAAQTALDRIATGADAIATAADRLQVDADHDQTALDVIATAADRVQTGLDVIATAADRVQTGLDFIATAADRVQTGIDAAAAAASAALAAGYTGTSTSSLLIAVASKTFTTQAGEQWNTGQWITATSAANPADWMYGQVTSYSGTTLVVDVQRIGGSGTKNDWNLNLSGIAGTAGAGITDQAVGFTATGGLTPKTLTVEDTSAINQDLTTDASPTFNQVNATTVHTTTELVDHIGEHTSSHGVVFDNDVKGGASGSGIDATIYATLGAELAPAMTQALWTEGAGWTITDLTGIATRVASAVTTLAPTSAIIPDITKKYKRVFTISSWTAGTITSTFGGVTSTPYSGDQVVSTYIDPYTTGNLIFTPSADFAGVVSLVSVKELTKGKLTVENDILHYDSRGHANRLAYSTRHLNEMQTDTLLDKSRSSLSCTGGVLTYTLFAMFGNGTFNFNGIPYPVEADSVSIALTAGTDAAPQINYVNFHLVGNTPTLRVSTTYPTDVHIDVATWLVGAVSGSSYTIYSYDRNRYEVDTFVKRVIERFEKSGTLYSSGGAPTVTQTDISIASGCEFFNGIFEMTAANTVTLAGFTIIKNGAFAAATTIAETLFYSDGTAVANNKFANVVWGIVPTTTTVGGTVATTVKLYAILQTKPSTQYTLAQARQDLYEATNYFPSNSAVKNVFVPICRTIVSEDNPTEFQTFDTGLYHKDIRGKITSGGGAASATDVSGLVPKTTTITATAPILIDNTTSADLSANRTVSITPSNTTTAGSIVAATAPGSGLRSVLAIDNGETARSDKALFDATDPSTQAYSDAAAVGTAMTAARRDHKHAMPAIYALADEAVTNAKLAHVATSIIKGRVAAGTGDVEDLSATNVRTIINVADGANAYVHPNHTGEVTSVADGATTIAANAVTLAKLATQAADTVLANVTDGAAVPTAYVVDEQEVLGRITGGRLTGLSAAQILTLINVTAGANVNVYASAAEINTGTEAAKSVSPDSFAGSNAGVRFVTLTLNGATALTTSEKCYQGIPVEMNGMDLISVRADCKVASSSGAVTITIKNGATSMLSTNITLDESETNTDTAAVAAAINTSEDDVATGDLIEAAVSGAGTGVTYCSVTLGFRKP